MDSKISKVLENKKIADDFYLLRIENRFKQKFLPGNFIHIKIENTFLRRPFSVAIYSKKFIGIIYKKIGVGTEILSKKKKGDFLDILGPCGNSFPIFRNKKVCLIAGGTGIAPLIFLSNELKKNKNEIYFFYGARNRKLIFFELLQSGINYIFSTDDGSFGYKGNIFDRFIEYKDDYDILYAAGPEQLLKKISLYSSKKPLYISLENYMACGMGLCYGCVVKIKEGNDWSYKRVCKDGPIFEAKNIIWE
ncbi:MAG: dihydroorotate dehydrogenase electron transfer subunit [Candidatus Omnitrophica bacterium]|nr:dihydroorotate dehydrogenase electron transfer subunit [Candidatus Omnitrophota bacterium]MCM8811251.1 dihydroorotate dehydrogenase electron transfer subunit [Candidatus Omnitrophota bacterium]